MYPREYGIAGVTNQHSGAVGVAPAADPRRRLRGCAAAYLAAVGWCPVIVATFTPEFARRILDGLATGAFDKYLTAAARERLRSDALRSLPATDDGEAS
jgi:hypothetical protein